MIRILLVEDSVTQREILKRLLSDGGELAVIAEARNGREAVERVRQHAPDVVLMDIHMPDMDGISATRQIMRENPVPIVIASATLKKREVDLAMKAYEAGAVAVIEKPAGAVLLHLEEIGPALREEIIAASKVRRPRLTHSSAARPLISRSPPRPTMPNRTIAAIGICASTGGPPVLMEILRELPKPYPLPVLLVQHISHGFEEGFARWLGQSTGQPVNLARDGQRMDPGVWLSPTRRHLTLGSPARIETIPGQAADIHCPSGNPLFVSLARHLGPRCAGILLTGMGDDGAAGLLALKQAGGWTVIQEETSCLIWGMPKAARQAGAATDELAPGEIARALTEIAVRCPTSF